MVGISIPVLDSVISNESLMTTLAKVFANRDTIPVVLAEDFPKYSGHKKGTYIGEIWRVDECSQLAEIRLSPVGETFAHRITYDGLRNELIGTVIDISVEESPHQKNVFFGHADLIRLKEKK